MTLADLRAASPRAIVVGHTGGIGAALVQGLSERGFAVTGLSRSTEPPLDLLDEPSIEAAAGLLREEAPFSCILVATGLLHAGSIAPEKTYRDLDPAAMTRLLAVNAIGPALIAKHFLPLLAKDGPGVFAALSARVGSIGDNRLGGWYSYRASKAALNMLIKSCAIELARTHPRAVCVGLHPGTVDTALSAPFQRSVPPGQLFTAGEAAERLLHVIDGLEPVQTGRCFAWDGEEIDP